MALDWKRIPDGNHNGRPVYEYEAVSDGIKYHICWAYDAGFGLSISFADRAGYPDDVSHGIVWCRALYRCKDYAERYARSRMEAA